MKRLLQTATLLTFLSSTLVFGQDIPKPKRTMPVEYSKGRFMGGVGVTFIGLTAKTGGFVQDRLWLGAQGELHALLSYRAEAGLFARYYPWNRRLTTFVETGVSYGRFDPWDFDGVLPDPWSGKSPKLNLGMGIEYRITERFGLEALAKAGKLTAVNWIQPSFQGSLNYTFGRKR